jgi:hypothetical protein
MALVVYSNSDYEDVLAVQDTFLQKYSGRKVLLSNKTPRFSHHFDSVITYDDSLQYSKRVLQGMTSIREDYVLFLHDMDILVEYTPSRIEELVRFMKENSIDRVDLQYTSEPNNDSYSFQNIKLVRNQNRYAYNVNPSIWKRDVLLSIMSQFDRNYRQIESEDVQVVARQYRIYKLWTPKPIRAGYYTCTDLFVFLHITHEGRLLPTSSNELDPWINVVYRGILASFPFRRQLRMTMHGH